MEKFDPESGPMWGPVLEQLIVGVSHQISNRISTLAGVSDILSGDPNVPPILRALTDEVPKLEESIRLLRLLAAPREPEEAVEPLRMVDDAIQLAAVHPELRGVHYRVEAVAAPPVLVQPVEFTHRVVVILVAAGLAGERDVVVQIDVDGAELVVTAGGRAVRVRTLAAARGTSSRESP